MAEVIPTYEQLLRTGINTYYYRYNYQLPTTVGCAPGRVNLIGEHTDYNNGFVLPMALPMVTMVIGAVNNTSKINIYTDAKVNEDNYTTFKIPEETELCPGEPIWANIIKGIVNYFKGPNIPGFNAVITSSIPIEAGLAGSAALGVSTYKFLEELTNTKTEDLTLKALICQRCEHYFCHRPCGLMDQFVAVYGQKGHALLIDCLTLNYNQVPFDDPDVRVLIINSNIRPKDVATQYQIRTNQCFTAAKQMNLLSLRDAGTKDLQKYRTEMEDDTFRRARHVVTEIIRTVDASQALKLKDFISFGLLMLQSHNSLRDDFKATCAEVDELVQVTMEAKGVYGCRVTGAGFGGCIVSLVRLEFVDSIIQHIKKRFSGMAEFYIVRPSASNINLISMLHEINEEIKE